MKMTLDETWENQLRMSGWIAENYDGTIHPSDMKKTWLRSHRFTKKRMFNCFFCDYASRKSQPLLDCSNCPAFSNKSNKCGCEIYHTYNWDTKPKAFYAKIVELNKKRLRQK